MNIKISRTMTPLTSGRHSGWDMPVQVTLTREELNQLTSILAACEPYDQATFLSRLNSFSTDPQLGLALDIAIPERSNEN